MMTLRNFHRIRFIGFAGLLSVCMAAALLSGCGKKSFPKASEKTPPQIRDLQAQVTARGVELSWTVPQPAEDLSDFRYSIMRSQLKWENRNCLECPAPAPHELESVESSTAEKAAGVDRKFTVIDSRTTVFTAYRYQVTIHDRKGHPISHSNAVVAKAYPPPLPPGNVTAVTQTQGILLQWKPQNKDAQGQAIQADLMFRIERQTQNKAWERATSVPIKANTYLDQTVASDQAYTYRIVPVLFMDNSSISGEPSPTVQAKAPEAVPPPPPGTVWAVPSKGGLEIRWTESDGKVGGYHVYRREGKEIIRLTASPLQHPPYTDNSAKRNVIYFYAVSAVSVQPENKEGLLSKWVEIRNLFTE